MCYNIDKHVYVSIFRKTVTMTKNVSMRTIAKAAGVSSAAVAQALNDRPGFVSEQTRERIKAAARELGYRPNFGYKLMHSKETRTVGIMVACAAQMQENHIRNLVLKLLEEFEKRSCAAFCHVLPSDAEKAPESVREFLARGVERFVFLGDPFGDTEIISMLDSAGIPWVSTKATLRRHVCMNSSDGIFHLLEFISRKTEGKFRFLLPPLDDDNPRYSALARLYPELTEAERRRRFVEWLEQPGTGLYSAEFYSDACEIGSRALAGLLEREPELRGAAFSNDALALGGVRLMLERGRRDFIITGYNGDLALLSALPYPVSTAVFDVDRVAELLAERSFDRDPCEISVPQILNIKEK